MVRIPSWLLFMTVCCPCLQSESQMFLLLQSGQLISCKIFYVFDTVCFVWNQPKQWILHNNKERNWGRRWTPFYGLLFIIFNNWGPILVCEWRKKLLGEGLIVIIRGGDIHDPELTADNWSNTPQKHCFWDMSTNELSIREYTEIKNRFGFLVYSIARYTDKNVILC